MTPTPRYALKRSYRIFLHRIVLEPIIITMTIKIGMSMKRRYLMILLLHNIALFGHGFGATTFILLTHHGWQQIDSLCYHAQKKKISITSYDTRASLETNSLIVHGGRSTANCYIRFGFEEQLKHYENHAEIKCTPTQEFFNASTHQWTPAYLLKVGDDLLCAHNGVKTVAYVELVKKKISIYTVEVAATHTFFVTLHSVLTHNMVLPITFSVGLSVPFGAGAAGTIGSFFGPVTFVAGVALGCMAGLLVKLIYDDTVPTYTVDTYNASTFERHVKQQPATSHANVTFSEPHITCSPTYVPDQHTTTITHTYSANPAEEYNVHNHDTDGSSLTVIIPESTKTVIGCGDTTPQEPLLLISPAEPMPAFQCPGYRPLSDEERTMLSGICITFPIPESERGSNIICGGIVPASVDASDLIMAIPTQEAQKRWSESDKMRNLENRIKKLTPTVSNARPGDWYKNPTSNADDYAWAEKKWVAIRNSKDDVNRIAANMGIEDQIIQQIKDHIFHKIHKKRYETAPFDADPDMAKAWERLEAGNMVKADLELLKHEFAESLLMENQAMDYDTAHNIVETFFSWRNEL